ncbi:hypothetical protein GUJ93_ZPchr0001g32456 [Zizania palustris]|uniref:Uncharacterized protein n=1 Tax=Zizania palustris TaxID=103762 RepID=A0A8J5RU14_ZIZPA|nr:hypothetical protein GUJ93_ZPchr0001g32456 [Zizania palustris]
MCLKICECFGFGHGDDFGHDEDFRRSSSLRPSAVTTASYHPPRPRPTYLAAADETGRKANNDVARRDYPDETLKSNASARNNKVADDSGQRAHFHELATATPS